MEVLTGETNKLFEKLKNKFYQNIEKLQELNPECQLYHQIYNENESILKEVHQINKG